MLNEFAILVTVIYYTIYVFRIIIELIIAQFKTHILQNEQTCCHTDRQTGNINCGKCFVFPKIAKDRF